MFMCVYTLNMQNTGVPNTCFKGCRQLQWWSHVAAVCSIVGLAVYRLLYML